MTKASDLPPPPKAAIKPHRTEHHGVAIDDPYAWLRDPGYPEVTDEAVLGYLKEENAYFDAAMKPHEAQTEALFEEMKGRIKEDESTVPLPRGDFTYWSAFKEGTQYRDWYRRPLAGGDEHLFYSENAAAEGHDYYRLGALAISPDASKFAVLVDDDGSERFKLTIHDFATGEAIETVTDVGIGLLTFSSDSGGVVFTEVNDQWRSYRARYHRIGDDPANAHTIYEEKDDLAFSVSVNKSTDQQWIIVNTGENSSNEIRLVPAADPAAAPVLVRPRKPDVQYGIDSAHGSLWVLTNEDHVNFAIKRADPAAPSEWETIVEGGERTYLTDVTTHRDHMLVSARIDGLDQLILRDYASGDEQRVPFDEASYTAAFAGNPEYAPAAYRIGYASMVTPTTVYDYHPASRELEVLKVQEIPSGYDASLYVTERLMIEARDGVRVPVSVMRRKDFARDGSGKLFIYAYGAYGIAIPPGFSTSRLSLVDRGFAYAIAHIRGGDDLGYQWFLDGKLKARNNSFNDFVDVTHGLIDAGYARAGRVAAQGGSAGGKLMGAIVNQAPELYGAIVADVPFVDVLSTMLDDTLPLTPGEWNEWGNPITDPEAFALIRSYSPYDNVAAQAYPPMLITGGLTDPRVTYWEPAKWAARLRATKTDDNLLLLKINMGAGHGGKSGRWNSLHEVAEAYSFVLSQISD